MTTRHGLFCQLFIYILQLTPSYACRICDVSQLAYAYHAIVLQGLNDPI